MRAYSIPVSAPLPTHRKDNSARFKEMEKWMNKNLTGEGVGVLVKTTMSGEKNSTFFPTFEMHI